MNYHYVYRITNIKKNKHYYGARSCKISPKKDLGVLYFSSSKNKDFLTDQKENPDHYKYKIIKVFNSREEAISYEIKLHSKFNVATNDNFYNNAAQTSKGFDTTGKTFTFSEQHIKNMNKDKYGKKLSEERKAKISIN